MSILRIPMLRLLMIAVLPSLIGSVEAQRHNDGKVPALPFDSGILHQPARSVRSTVQNADAWKEVRRLLRSWNGTDWDTTSRISYSYDSEGRYQDILTEVREETLWVNSARDAYSYHSTGDLAEILHYNGWDWNTGEWWGRARDGYAYDSAGNLIEAWRQVWIGSTWKDIQRYLYAYDSAGNIVQQVMQYFSAAWDDQEEYLFYYDSTGFMTEYVWRTYGPSGWANAGRYTYTPDSNGYVGTAYYYYPVDSSWAYGETMHFTNTADGRPLEIVWENAGGFVRREGYSYDANDLLTEDVQQTWTGSWENLFRVVYSYDAHLNMSRRLSQNWDGEAWINARDRLLEWSFLATPVESDGLPAVSNLEANYPNPFNPRTTITYSLARPGMVTIKIFNTLGREIATLVDERKSSGSHFVTWDSRGLPSGVYYYRMTADEFAGTRRMILLK